MHGHANYGGRSNFPSPMNLRVFIVELVIRRAKQTIAGFPCAARYEILGKSPTGAQMWNICNEPNWLIILVLLLFGIIAPFAAVRVRSRASSKRLIKEFRNVWWVRYAREKKLDDEEIADLAALRSVAKRTWPLNVALSGYEPEADISQLDFPSAAAA